MDPNNLFHFFLNSPIGGSVAQFVNCFHFASELTSDF